MILPNGPKLPKIIQGIFYFINPYRFLSKCYKKYGDIFTMKLPGFTPMVVVSNPNTVKQIFTGDSETLRAGEANAIYFTEPFGKKSLLTLDGKEHLHARKLILPPLHGAALKNYGEKIMDITDEVISQWTVSKPFPILPQLQSITLQVILSVIFGLETNNHSNELKTKITEFLQLGENPVTSFISGLFPGLLKHPPKKIKNLINEINALIYKQIEHRRKNPSNSSDILNILITAKDENNIGLSDEELRDELIALLVAGHDTTATTGTWAIYNLLSNPDVYNKANLAISEAAGTEKTLSLDKIQNISCLQCIIKETQRFQPIVPLVARITHAPITLNSFEIPDGYTIAPCIYLAGKYGQQWENPDQFLPERFYEKNIDPYQYFPFGGGTRRCIGAAFAMFELQIMLAKILNQFTLSLKKNYQVKVARRGVTFGTSDGVPIIVYKK
jgi:unspecific monooxygenase